MSRRRKSLQLRLTVELGLLFFVASCLAVGGLIYSASLTAGSLADRELGLRAEDLAGYIALGENRKPRLELPPSLKQAYSAAAQQSLFAIRDKDGHLIEASTAEVGALIARWPQADSEPSYFRLSKFGPMEQDYSGVSIRLDSVAGPLSVLVAEASGGNQLVHSILREFVFDIAWYVPPFVAVALLLAAFSVRRSLLRAPRYARGQWSSVGAQRRGRANEPSDRAIALCRPSRLASTECLLVGRSASACRGGGRFNGASGPVSPPDYRADRRRSSGPGHRQCCRYCRCAAQSH